ncbi:AraC family transcriptional regulator [Dyadobacter sp. CY347]|uniref:helix-turn-helix domain-containing protein n=1 Tax=Dyadobacter sp. CY347 TaxID=2909336 RepID=UPI001F2CB23F|nr:AraC family transcriptional regulator [Dyadobacter sp. CY347]MCF2489316.1 AraC family transcriptional regulator [Dyadobacter sp. CY347]
MILYIKNMVSLRCKLCVKDELRRLRIGFLKIELGSVNLTKNITADKQQHLKERLAKSGLELIEDKKSILIEKIKGVIIEMVHFTEDMPKTNYSDYISKKLGYDYTYLSNLFTAAKGIDIQHYIIHHKIERVKELLQYKELNLTEISYMLHYSSVSHLSNQFKKVTGISPSVYNLRNQNRTWNLENI